MRVVLLLLLLASTSTSVIARQYPSGDTLHIFILNPGYRLSLRDSVYLCRTPAQLKTFLQRHARGISHASIETAPEEPVDSVMALMRVLDKMHIRTAMP